jgi:hypothetical protein
MEAVIRIGLALALPVLLIWFQSLAAIILICGISGYLLITGMMFFCFVKYFFQHTVSGRGETNEERENPVKEL